MGKVAVVGDWGVGKTSIVQQFIAMGAGFPKNYSMTLGCELSTKQVNIPDQEEAVELLFIDSSGRDMYVDLLKTVWENISMIMVVVDVTKEETYGKARLLIDHIKELNKDKSLSGVVLANKIDLTERRQVPAKTGAELASGYGLLYFECSAKSYQGIEEPCFYLANEWHKLHADTADSLAIIA
ncbi:intraflagellar transport protein 27 homolog isoform X2 [Eurytemora carolleeae]|uniref:intraflagellar transport protein 27 homolog isoform X2 n=1 Tax=Eurytemora carolleeae TaxID=1294199 RepID=UPI000C774C85|nr:intraflagellar transport protein 27 homolog isoform X2 [Eurytemora carolleeae]|eukprot:XP_023340899.1 intraflagellar transport protein 27 homolog isoform X2 [Eurytemora affinis]